ncbi:MAG: Nramp family divalent metal transporter, partial [Planctomycetaceae bacterium]|nr:Nramp family divalent metal transporter [Planctomycetaceae bacterium]
MTTPPTVAAGALAPWEIDNLPEPPRSGRKLWLALIGPGVVLAGTSIGTGEWLFGPVVSAQYGASLFWLAMISIVLQGFANLMFMRYAIYCGEPMNVGILRTWPGPMAWIIFFGVLDVASFFPYNASNAAVPLAAAFLGRLPRPEDMLLVRGLGIAIFLLCFVPLLFGGTVYRMLEKIMAAKLVVVLGYLSIIAVTMVSAPVFWDVVTGFFSFGTVPLRPDTLIVDRHFSVRRVVDGAEVLAKGTWERKDDSVTGELQIIRGGTRSKFNLANANKLSEAESQARDDILERTKAFVGTKRFLIEFGTGTDVWIAEGDVINNHTFEPSRITVIGTGPSAIYSALDQVPEPHRSRLANHLQHEGLAYVNAFDYVSEHGRLPPLDWAMVVAFVAIAGAGGLTNTMFSNYARDKGWGMG